MKHIKNSQDKGIKSKKRKKSKQFIFNPTREEVEEAVQEYLVKGGKIKRIEPEWIEEGRAYIFE